MQEEDRFDLALGPGKALCVLELGVRGVDVGRGRALQRRELCAEACGGAGQLANGKHDSLPYDLRRGPALYPCRLCARRIGFRLEFRQQPGKGQVVGHGGRCLPGRLNLSEHFSCKTSRDCT